MGEVIIGTPFGAGDSNGARTSEELASMGRHPTAKSGGEMADSRTPGEEPYLVAVSDDPEGSRAAKTGEIAALNYLYTDFWGEPGLLGKMRDRWKRREMKPKYRIRRVGATVIAVSLVFGAANPFGARDAVVDVVEEAVVNPFKQKPPVRTPDGFCFVDGGLGGDRTYPPSPDGKC
jgi:hypothetical protein